METSLRRPRPHDWISLGATLAALVSVVALAGGRLALALVSAAAAAVGLSAARRSSRRHPTPMPYALRWVLFLPRWPLSVARLRSILEPRVGERVLEVGPGVGIYAVPMAAALAPGGSLEALDVQREMLNDLARRARAAGVSNIATTEGDAQNLPYPDGSFDAAYLIGVCGEIPDPGAALRELRRVLKPGGRLVVGEVLGVDPDAMRLSTLCAAAAEASFAFERRLGPRFAYYARFRRYDGKIQ